MPSATYVCGLTPALPKGSKQRRGKYVLILHKLIKTGARRCWVFGVRICGFIVKAKQRSPYTYTHGVNMWKLLLAGGAEFDVATCSNHCNPKHSTYRNH